MPSEHRCSDSRSAALGVRTTWDGAAGLRHTLGLSELERVYRVNSSPPEKSSSEISRLLLTWGSLALAAAESLCVAAIGLNGMRVAVGLGSLLAATAGGPAQGFHRSALRIPFLVVGAGGALLSLLLLWNEERIRRNPSAAWRVRPLNAQQRRRRWLQLVLALLTLLLVALELITHPRFHHEL